jgi:xylulokinase
VGGGGERKADPDAGGAFVGLSIRHDRGALTRAVLEGVAFALKDSLDLTEELGGTPELGRISGGGARSALWTRIIASVLELPLEPVAVDEGAAFGAAILGGVAAETWPDVQTAVQQTVKPKAPIEPVPEWIEPYREQRERFRKLYPALKAVR